MATTSQGIPTPSSGVAGVTSPVHGYVDWGAIIAGALIAAATFFLFTTFGSAVGLSVTSPWSGASARTLGIAAAIWFLLVQVGSFAVGGYFAGRMRHRFGDATEDETEFRDGAHGFLVWALGFILSALLVVMTTTSIVQSTVQGGAAAVSAAARNSNGDMLGSAVDTMFRSTNPPAQGQQASDPRAEAVRVIGAAAARGELSAADRTYLAQLVAQRTGISQQDAEQRVNQAVEQAKQAADRARKVSAVTGFLVAASLVVSAAAAWFASQSGGNHRDQGTLMPWLRRRRALR